VILGTLGYQASWGAAGSGAVELVVRGRLWLVVAMQQHCLRYFLIKSKSCYFGTLRNLQQVSFKTSHSNPKTIHIILSAYYRA